MSVLSFTFQCPSEVGKIKQTPTLKALRIVSSTGSQSVKGKGISIDLKDLCFTAYIFLFSR